jgi:hypothetical protein
MTARATVAWLTPRRAATSLELINLCKDVLLRLTKPYQKAVGLRTIFCDQLNEGLGISRAAQAICR